MSKASTNNRQLLRRGDLGCWVADAPQTGDEFLAVFNAQERAPASEAAKSPLIIR